MPKLAAAAAKAVGGAEAVHGGGTFEPLAPGDYLARLRDVTVRDNTDKYGAAQWSAEFENLVFLEDREPAPGRQWLNLTIPIGKKVPEKYPNGPEKWEKYQEMVKGRLKAFFEAFGFTTDSDTDELVGEYAVITLRVRTIQSGPKEGQLTNEVVDIKSLEDVGIDDPAEYGINAEELDTTVF